MEMGAECRWESVVCRTATGSKPVQLEKAEVRSGNVASRAGMPSPAPRGSGFPGARDGGMSGPALLIPLGFQRLLCLF